MEDKKEKKKFSTSLIFKVYKKVTATWFSYIAELFSQAPFLTSSTQ